MWATRHRFLCSLAPHFGATENAGTENARRSKSDAGKRGTEKRWTEKRENIHYGKLESQNARICLQAAYVCEYMQSICLFESSRFILPL